MTADVRTILAAVGVLRWGLDDINVGMFCWICRPLDGYARPTDAVGNAVEEFKFQNKEMVKGLVPFPTLALASRIACLFLWKRSSTLNILVRV